MARILVIEDNAINLELMLYVLQAWQHDVLVAHDGVAGLAMARSERPDLVLCDLQLPGMDGEAVARALRADTATAATPLVAVTAQAREVDRERALAAGFDAVFSKPIDPVEFMAGIQRFLPGEAAPPPEPMPRDVLPDPGSVPPELRAPRQPCWLLTVDDGPTNLVYKRNLFEPAGYSVLTTHGVTDALALLRAEPVDLVVSDVVMADGGGFELLRRLRADPAWRDLPFIFLTSTARDSVSRAHGLSLGAQDYLVRPLDAAELLAAIARALRPARAR